MAHLRLRSVLAGAAGLALAAALSAPAEADGTPAENIDGVPTAEASDAQWYAWSEQVRAQARATDWAADAAARGCTLVRVTITDVTMPQVSAAAGAPEDLLTPQVEREEQCDQTQTLSMSGSGDAILPLSVPAGSQCNGYTRGPGTICVSRSGSSVVASFAYRGSGSVSGFIRIYQVPPGSNGCPTGSTIRTGPVQGYTAGVQRSVSVTVLQNAAFSAHFWRSTAWGYTDWGAACGVL